MRRSRWFIALLVSLSFIAAACGDDEDPAVGSGDVEASSSASEAPAEDEGGEPAEHPEDSTMARIAEEGSITIGTKFDQPLFGLVDPRSGDVEGFDVEIARLIAERIGPDVEVEFVETPSAIRETAITDGTVDMVVATYTINDKRKESIAFAGPYYVAGQDIMVAAGDDSIGGVEDLAGKRVCSVQGSTSVENIRSMAPEAEVTEYDVYSKCADDLRNGRVDAVSTDNVILAGLVSTSEGAFELVDNPFTEEPYGIGVAKDDTDFRMFVNDVLEEIFESGEWADAYESTVGTVDPETPEPPTVDRY
ncbi:MAG TPA: glutamate ABC transporter substrate-binding protein [Acidimicrobiales bacterium]|nr:glutamate ABC transporter substrate-binding protein [Acidimicrobiales bacterium]